MERSVCNRNCWISGAIAGVLVLLFASGVGDLPWGGGLFLGLVAGLLSGGLLVWLLCNGRPDPFEGPDQTQGLTRTDWERSVAEHQPDALLVSSTGPEGVTSTTQMPIVAGAMPRGPSGRDGQPARAEDAT